MTELTEWDSFYVIVGAAAGALIGLQFVVLTLIAERPPVRAAEAGAAFATPTIVHFSAALLVSALLCAPWHSATPVTALCALVGVYGAVYVLIVARRMRSQQAYRPELEDWIFHLVVPLAGYLMLGASAALAPTRLHIGLFMVAAGVLLLLFAGIHNAWDAVAYHVLVHRARDQE